MRPGFDFRSYCEHAKSSFVVEKTQLIWCAINGVRALIHVWRYDEQQNRMDGSPALIEQQWPGIPSPIDAAVFYEGSAALGFDSQGDDMPLVQMMCTLHFFPNRFCASVQGKRSLQIWPRRQTGGLDWTRQWSSGVQGPKGYLNKSEEGNGVTHLMKLLQRSTVCWEINSMCMGTSKYVGKWVNVNISVQQDAIMIQFTLCNYTFSFFQ